MKQLVINKFDKVAVTIGMNCVHNVYNSLTEAIEAVSRSYYNTVWSEVNEDVRFYGWVTESNGYQHTVGNPIYTCKESSFWGGKMPQVSESRKKKTFIQKVMEWQDMTADNLHTEVCSEVAKYFGLKDFKKYFDSLLDRDSLTLDDCNKRYDMQNAMLAVIKVLHGENIYNKVYKCF